MKTKDILKEMTIREKAEMLIGESFYGTRSLDRFDIRSLTLIDGPHGIRKQEEKADHLGQAESIKASSFPSLVNVASTWNRELAYRQGELLAAEAKLQDVDVVLGPGANIKRSPLCGRNFEYFSEDPYISGHMAKEFIDGLQDNQVGACIKHFFGNNQEKNRLTVNSVIDERAVNEIYFKSFEYPIKEAKPYMVMAAYNKVNGEFGAENEVLLKEYLRKRCNYDGVVVTDWGGINDIVKGIKATLDLEMPDSGEIHINRIIEAIENKTLSMDELDSAVSRILEMHEKLKNRNSISSLDYKKQEKAIEEIARESVVLLKNENNVLPLDKNDKIVLIGEFAVKPRYQGGGSSNINPYSLTNAYDELIKLFPSISYFKGFDVDGNEDNSEEIEKITSSLTSNEKVVVFAGLSEKKETEGKDRENLSLPLNQINLIREVSAVNKNVIIVLSNGSAIEMPFEKNVAGIVEGYLLGQTSGTVLTDVLVGKVNPSGKLAETFPLRLQDTPSFTSFPGNAKEVRYDESIFVGYRYYDTKSIDVLYPFGHGLSYTKFEYDNLKLSKETISDEEVLNISLDVKNTGDYDGKEVVQLYIGQNNQKEIRPYKELIGFEKVSLLKGETKSVEFEISRKDLEYYSTYYNCKVADDSEFTIMVGSSSSDIRLTDEFTYKNNKINKIVFNYNSTFGEVRNADPKIGNELIEKFKAESGIDWDLGDRDENFAEDVIAEFQLKSLVLFTKGKFSYKMLDEILGKINN